MTDVEQGFLPWLMGEVEERIQEAVVSRMLLDDLIRYVVSKRNKLYEQRGRLTPTKITKSRKKGKKGPGEITLKH